MQNVLVNEHVILLHGLARTSRSMAKLEAALRGAGYSVDNVDYPSRTAVVERLAEALFPVVLGSAAARSAEVIHFVTHSMGGILLRYYLEAEGIAKAGRAVMMAPPNQGSEVVDCLRRQRLFQIVNGPAGQQLGTDADSLPRRLGPVTIPCGVIAGSRTINWIQSLCMIPGRNDGKVSVESTRVEGMLDHIVLPVSHPLIMRNQRSISQTLHFLREGRFAR